MDDLTKIQRYKRILIGVWIFAALSFIPPFASGGFASFGQSVFFMMVAIHVIECVVFLRALRSTGEPLGSELAKTMVFGVLHYQEIKLGQGGSA